MLTLNIKNITDYENAIDYLMCCNNAESRLLTTLAQSKAGKRLSLAQHLIFTVV